VRLTHHVTLSEHIGERLWQARIDAGIAQNVIAHELGVTRNTVCNWEAGRNQPSYERIYELARRYEVSPVSFFPELHELTYEV